jgi:hypothetical protein
MRTTSLRRANRHSPTPRSGHTGQRPVAVGPLVDRRPTEKSGTRHRPNSRSTAETHSSKVRRSPRSAEPPRFERTGAVGRPTMVLHRRIPILPPMHQTATAVAHLMAPAVQHAMRRTRPCPTRRMRRLRCMAKIRRQWHCRWPLVSRLERRVMVVPCVPAPGVSTHWIGRPAMLSRPWPRTTPEPAAGNLGRSHCEGLRG